ncbi:MAG TPA: triose-phosphate isomerase [Candidatus Levybacteria bacterium]|nr:triose-phosphate isomerase [Candidatus Levybacteria bacterium]
MTRNLIAANWKSHKSLEETKQFFETLTQSKDRLGTNQTDVVICPSFTSLETAKKLRDAMNLSVLLGGQDVSPFPEGAYTGAIAATQLREIAEYVIIGHSERRSHFGESEAMIEQKINQAKEAGLQVILCVQDAQGIVYEGVDVVAYEPISAIGTGNPDSPENVIQVLETLHERYPSVRLLYGGSVDKNSIHTFTQIPLLHGFLVGGASLEPESFLHLIAACDTRNSH